MILPLETFEDYTKAEDFRELAGPGSRILRLPAEDVASPPITVAAGTPQRPTEHRARSVDLRCAKVARALCVRRGVIVDLDTGRVLPDVVRKPRDPLPATVELDLAGHGIDESVDWEALPAAVEPGPGYYADCWHLGYGHVLLEALSRCWALECIQPVSGVVVTHKAARSTYLPWFEALGVDAGRLRSTRRGPLRVDDLLVPTPAYVIDRGMSPRFHRITGHIAAGLGAADGCERLFVSRRGAEKRRLLNEPEVEALFVTAGFRIIEPELLPIEDQVRAFAGASVVAGCVGSGLYSIAFSRPGTRLMVLAPDRFFTRNDQILAGARTTPPVFAFGETTATSRQEAMFAGWHLDPAHAAAALQRAVQRAP